ncbi:MAG: oxygen-independent coproporphyrinogen III oxidase [Rhodobacteraceae bacterium]|nr:oxygen-independent coproporphyrinogen III oxidase [Paracoccaceae bacterium]
MDRIAQLRRMGLFDARVPRYTSYPSADHFTSDVDATNMESWLADIPPGSAVSMYIHIPFCKRLCWFCACRTQGTPSSRPVAAYLGSVYREIELIKGMLPKGVSLGRLHWGGGTPTLLTRDMIEQLVHNITNTLPFSDDYEFSVEIDPNEIDDERMDALVANGMNRASVGVQDFNPSIQKTIGRPQSFDLTRDAIDGLRARGIPSLNVDILYGLPDQTPERISESVQKVLSLSPDRVALYGYAHVPWMARRQSMIPTESLPKPEERMVLAETARKLFIWDNYEEIGIDHFAKKHDGLALAAQTGRLRRNFQGYTDDLYPVLLGLGASAISRFPQGYAQNAAATSVYRASVDEGRLATLRGHQFSGEDIVRAAVIESLMCDFEVNFERLAERTQSTPERIERLFDGIERRFPEMTARSGSTIQIRREAFEAVRLIAQYIDAYVVSESGHSPAI